MIIFGAIYLDIQQCSCSQIVNYWAYIKRIREESWLLNYQSNSPLKTCMEAVSYISKSK